MNTLLNLWNAEKQNYQAQEIGSGVQKFVKKVFLSPEIFDLKEGKLSTKDENRENEFLEEARKHGRRADIIVFINNEIIIPVEIERLGNIEKGVTQLFQYQIDWNKKYGILTDGNEWRFYKSNIYRTFYLHDILEKTEEFLTFWKFYIKPENYYIDLFTNETNNLFTNKLDLNFAENRTVFFDEITQLIKNFRIKMKLAGAFANSDNEKLEVETSYAYLIQFILYKVLVDNEFKRFKTEYNRLFEKIKKAIKDADFYSIIINEMKNISEFISENIYKPFIHEQKSINQKLTKNLKTNLLLEDIAPWLDILLFINRYNFAGLKNEIFGFIYENFLKDLYEDKNKGQYFTDPNVVNFMLTEIGYNSLELKDKAEKNEISIIDPSCGAGTFLYSAVDRIIETFDNGTPQRAKQILNLVKQNIFGIDIEEFPLYLAEMNILMRLLPLIINDNFENPFDEKIKVFKTKDSISEFLNVNISSKKEELNLFSHFQKTSLNYPSFLRDEKNLESMILSMQEKDGMRERFDYVVGNPPYISYNECCRQQIDFTLKIKDKNDNSISMSDVYGMNLNTVAGRRKPYSPKPNLYAFFVALGLALLKDGGKLSFIIPQTILINRDLDVLRYHLAKNTTIEKIITFEGKMFVGRGLQQNKPIATSSLIFVVKKQIPNPKNIVKVTNFKPYTENNEIDFAKYLKSDLNEFKEILQSEFLQNVENWAFMRHEENFTKMYDEYKKNTLTFEEYRRTFLKHYDEIQLDKGLVFNRNKNTNIETQDTFRLAKSSNKYNVEYESYFLNKQDFTIPQGSQGLTIFENHFKIVWSYTNLKFYFSDFKNLMVGSAWLIISSENKNEILFILSLLNFKINIDILLNFLKLNAEAMLIASISSIKQFIRIPRITPENQQIKNKIIDLTTKLLELENYQLKDFVEFTTSIQKFVDVIIYDDRIELIENSGRAIGQKIKQKPEVVKQIIEEQNYEGEINLQNLKYLEVIDKQAQTKLKNEIDDLIFALYFNEEIEKVKENIFYKLINN